MVRFVSEMLKDRSTTLRFDDHFSETITLNNGIGQAGRVTRSQWRYTNSITPTS
jgi:hypothetical protein